MAHKVRIVQRKDGAVFTWTPVLDAMPAMHPGWLEIKEDGTQEVQLDKATVRELDPSTVSQRERQLIAENARLRQMLAAAGGLAVAEAPEVPLPPVPDVVADLTVPVAMDEEPIAFQPEPPHYTRSRLRAMNKPEIEAHIRQLDRLAGVPDGASKDDLIELSLSLQGDTTED